MSAELTLVTQLAIILVAAGVFTVISKALKQPLILGYIVAGFIVGPHLGLFPQFSPESVKEWSELGIIFLLFGLGLEFSFKKLLNVGSTAVIAAGTICVGMFITGSLTGSALGWSQMESFFLGGMMSMSSTTIIIKAYDDLGIKNKPYAALVFGLLVVEDLIAVLMMVLFSTMAVSNAFSGTELLASLAKLTIFLVLCFIIGIYVIPTLLKKAKKYLSDEILLLISVGLCFLMVILANKSGFSSALGAFLMGSILSSTLEGEHIEHITTSIKNLFGAIFFVSVGMMIDPSIIASQWPVILVITLVAMAGILIFSTAGTLLAGKNLDTALHVGFSLPQLGEFSFIIAGLGVSLGVLREFIYPVIISVSVITTFTTPYMIKAADPVSAWLHGKLPEKWLAKLSKRTRNSESQNSMALEALRKQFIVKYFVRIGIYSLLSFVFVTGLWEFLPTLMSHFFPFFSETLTQIVECCIAVLVIAPFTIGIAINTGNLRSLATSIVKISPKSETLIVLADIFRILLAELFTLAAIRVFVTLPIWVMTLLFILGLACILWARKKGSDIGRVEKRFFTNLNEKEESNRKAKPVSTAIADKMSEQDIKLLNITVSPDFEYIGQILRDIPFKSETGVNIVKIKRGSKSIIIPSGNEMLLPGDDVLAVGSAAQTEAFSKFVEGKTTKSINEDSEEFLVKTARLQDGSILNGKTLKECNLKAAGCLVICVERDGATIANPHKDFAFRPGDTVWFAGLKSSLDSLVNLQK